MEDKTSTNELGKETPQAPEEKEPQPNPSAEKTVGEDEIKALLAQKEHQRSKREEAEARAKALEEENAKLKEKLQSSIPSEEELVREYPDWDLLDQAEKKRLIDEREREKRLRRLEEQLAWENDFKSLVSKEEFADIDEAEFKKFAYQYPKEVELETLAKAFLYGKKEPEPEDRKGLEVPTGGRGKVLSPEMTAEDLKRLRENSPKEYEKLLRQGRLDKIKFEKP